MICGLILLSSLVLTLLDLDFLTLFVSQWVLCNTMTVLLNCCDHNPTASSLTSQTQSQQVPVPDSKILSNLILGLLQRAAGEWVKPL